MKTRFNKAYLFLMGLVLLSSGSMKAGIIDKFKKFAGTEFNDYRGLYIMAGVIVAGLVLYLIVNHFGKEEEEKSHRPGANPSHRRHHHHHRVIKKTA